MSIALTARSVRLIASRVVEKKYGISLNDYIRLMREGSAPDDENLQGLIRRLPEW